MSAKQKTTTTIQEIANHLQPSDNQETLSKRLNIPLGTLQNRVKKHPDTWKLLLFKQWDKALADVDGWTQPSELNNILPLPKALYNHYFEEYQEYREANDKRPISRRNTSQKQTYFIPPRTSKRHEQNLKHLNTNGQRIYRSLIGTGRSPSVMAATAQWLTTDKSQRVCADEFGVTPVSIRNCRDYLEKQGMLEK